MAGLMVSLRLPESIGGTSADAWPDVLLDGIARFAKGRASERGVRRLKWSVPTRADPDLSTRAGTPEDWGLNANDHLDVFGPTGRDDLAVSLASARRTWPPSPWAALGIDYDVPPGAEFPELFGALHWSVFWHGGWRVRAVLEYPESAPRRDPRWDAWFGAFEQSAIEAVRGGG